MKQKSKVAENLKWFLADCKIAEKVVKEVLSDNREGFDNSSVNKFYTNMESNRG